MPTWCAFTHIVRRALGLEANSVILTLVVLAGAVARQAGRVIVRQGKHRRDLAVLARKAWRTHACVALQPIHTRRPVQADVGLTVIHILRAVLACEPRNAFTPARHKMFVSIIVIVTVTIVILTIMIIMQLHAYHIIVVVITVIV
jgi:hypothetical protein